MTEIHIGVTGTRHKLTAKQKLATANLLQDIADSPGELFLHHGDCTGADEWTAYEARTLGYTLVGHPPVMDRHRAHVPSEIEFLPEGYLKRNRQIVASVSQLIVLPNDEDFNPCNTVPWKPGDGGTAYTCWHAYATPGIKIHCIWPDGVQLYMPAKRARAL